MNVHPVFKRFSSFEGWAEPGFEFGFYGVNIRDWLFAGKSKGFNTRRFIQIPLPAVDEEYFEWIALMTAVDQAHDSFCMAEIGAGWGRWIASGAMLCRQRALDVSLVAVEAEPSHFEWMRMVLVDNGLDPDQHRLILGAVIDHSGQVTIAGADPRTHYGQRVIPDLELSQWKGLPGYTCRRVRAVTLDRVLEADQSVDLLDMDVQGAEREIVDSSMDTLDRKVKIVHIGTHGLDIESAVEGAFASRGWLNAFLFPSHAEAETPYGRVAFVDGVQTWVNPRWPELHAALTAAVPSS